MASLMEFEVYATYRQVIVLDPSLTTSYNCWIGDHVRQGFSWRPGAASFATRVNGGRVRIRVELGGQLTVPDDAVRAVVVPFGVTGDTIEVGSIFDARPCPVPTGTYELLFAIVPATDSAPETCCLQFVPCANPAPRHLRVDDDLEPLDPPLMEAEPG